MAISSSLQSVFAFRTISTTVFASLFYLSVFFSIYITQYAPSVPAIAKQQALGLNFERAYRDLHLVGLLRHVVFGIHHVTFHANRSQSVLIPTILVKMTSFAISCYNDYEK
jgi:hypothetical protein